MIRLLAFLLALSSLAQDKAPSRILALRGAKVYTGSGAPIEGGTILIEAGRITAVGKDVVIPSDARIQDVTGKVIIPGLIDAASRLLLEAGDRGGGSPEQDVLDGLDHYAGDFKESVEQGVVAVFVTPTGFGPINGLGAVIRLDARRTVLLRHAALKVTLGASLGDTSSAAQRFESYQQLRQALDGARQYVEAGEKYRKDLAEYEQKKKDPKPPAEPPKPRKDPRNEVLARLLDRKQPLAIRIEAHTADALSHALRLVTDYRLRAILEQATEGDAVAEAIAKAKIPVVAGPVFRYGPGTTDYLNHSIGTPAALVKAGVAVAIGSFGDDRAGLRGGNATRFLAESAALAASRGLTREQALATVTLEAAKILGVDKDLGSIDKGKSADLVLLSGEPFESGTVVESTLIQGEAVYTRGGP